MNTFTSILEAKKAFAQGKITSLQLVQRSIDEFNGDKNALIPLNAFLELYSDAVENAEKADQERTEAASKGPEALKALLENKPLLGMPFAIKDNISVKGKKLTCASHILEGYTAPYNATVVQRLLEAGAIPVGRCNQDEFAMGSSTEYSIYGPTRNPINREYVSGGSSGGSAAAVASNQALFALGTETGGSVRLPASYCGIYGLKPTYGVLSRWGVVAFGSSLDQVGLFGHTPSDIALPLSVMSGVDFYDDTSVDLPGSDTMKAQLLSEKGSLNAISDQDLAKLKIAIPRQFMETKGLDPEVSAVFENVKTGLCLRVLQLILLICLS